jgi:hypothetical protein
MRSNPPRRHAAGGWSVGLALAALMVLAPAVARAQSEGSARQVTVFGIVATPNQTAIDPKLHAIAGQLRRLLPNHGFRLLDVQSKRLAAGQSVTCNLGNGFTSATTLMQPLDPNGKVVLRCEILENTVPQLATLVSTPPNQLFFCDKMLPSGSRLLIGVGAR